MCDITMSQMPVNIAVIRKKEDHCRVSEFD